MVKRACSGALTASGAFEQPVASISFNLPRLLSLPGMFIRALKDLRRPCKRK